MSGKYKKPDNSCAKLQKHFEKLEKAVRKSKKGSSSDLSHFLVKYTI